MGRQYGPYGGGEESGTEFSVSDAILLYISGQAGRELDGITLHFGTLGNCSEGGIWEGSGSGSGWNEPDDSEPGDYEYPPIVIPTINSTDNNEIISNWTIYDYYEGDISAINNTDVEPIK